MPPDFLLRCTACGHEAVWDTEVCPPVGMPEVGHPVLWQCGTCGSERRHVVACQVVITEKLCHDICVATEIDRPTVDRVMGELHRHRQRTLDALADIGSGSTEIEDIADATGVVGDVVGQIANAEAAWMVRRGYSPGEPLET